MWINWSNGSKISEESITLMSTWDFSREVQIPLNQEVGSKPSRAVDFASRFIIIIESMNLEFRIYWKYESRYKINGSRKF
jgi:hypothetical protein